MKPVETKSLLAEVRANHARLDACAGPHEFAEPAARIGPIVTTHRCVRCAGTVSTSDKRWYEHGLAHGARR